MVADSLPMFAVFDPKLAGSTLLPAAFEVLDAISVTQLAISVSLLTVLSDSVADSLEDSQEDSLEDSLAASPAASLPDSPADSLADLLELEHPYKSSKVGGTKKRKYYILIVLISITIQKFGPLNKVKKTGDHMG